MPISEYSVLEILNLTSNLKFFFYKNINLKYFNDDLF